MTGLDLLSQYSISNPVRAHAEYNCDPETFPISGSFEEVDLSSARPSSDLRIEPYSSPVPGPE